MTILVERIEKYPDDENGDDEMLARCKSHFTDLGGDWDKANKCLHKYDDKIKKGTDCVRKALGDV